MGLDSGLCRRVRRCASLLEGRYRLRPSRPGGRGGRRCVLRALVAESCTDLVLHMRVCTVRGVGTWARKVVSLLHPVSSSPLLSIRLLRQTQGRFVHGVLEGWSGRRWYHRLLPWLCRPRAGNHPLHAARSGWWNCGRRTLRCSSLGRWTTLTCPSTLRLHARGSANLCLSGGNICLSCGRLTVVQGTRG